MNTRKVLKRTRFWLMYKINHSHLATPPPSPLPPKTVTVPKPTNRPRPAPESKLEVKITDEEFDQYLKDIGFGEEPEAETIRELYPPITSDQLTETEINRVINLQITSRNDLPSFVLYKEKEIFKIYVADLVEDHVLGKDLYKLLVSMEPRVSELVEGEIVNDGQKVPIIIRAIVEGISYCIEVVVMKNKK